MSEKHDIAGQWWFPTNPDERWLGTLKFEPDKAPHLSIPLAKSFDEAEKLGQPPAILGRNNNGFPITLLFPGWPRLHGGTELCQMDFSAHHALIGIHFANEDDFKVNTLNIRLQRLQAWLGDTGFSNIELPEKGAVVRYKIPPDEKFVINDDLSVELQRSFSLKNDLTEKKLRENAQFTIVSKAGINLRQFKEYLNAVRQLLHFATMEQIYPLKITLQKDGHGYQIEDKFYLHEIELLNSIIKEDDETFLSPGKWLFRFSDVRQRFAEFFSAWLKLNQEFDEALKAYYGTVYHNLPTEIDHICITQALEAYHGTKFASHGQRDFCGKIQEITEKYKSQLSGLVVDVPEFAKTVRDNRHYYTHHNPDDLKNGRVVKGSKLIQLNENLTLIFQMCILTEMGIASDRFGRLRFQLAQKTMDLI
jgi:ApeA N-terminal domain 1